MSVRVLGVESSCDETAAAVVRDDGLVLGEAVRSQIAAHAPYGGVVPEIAARDHIRAVVPVVEQALAEAECELDAVDAIAVTNRPGLIGALLVGVQAAKGIAWARGKPLVGVDHLVGHLLSVFLHDPKTPAPEFAFPFIGLLVSGGHTALYRCEGPTIEEIHELGATRDDAVGEAFDKVAKLLGLGYPGGPVVDRLAAEGDASRIELPRPMGRKSSAEFSFSGLKSAVARRVASSPPQSKQELRDLCAAFQGVVTRTLVGKTVAAAEREKIGRVVVAGGVAANRELRDRMARVCNARQLELRVPPFKACTDNAAMIAYAGACRLAAGQQDDATLGPFTVTAMPRVTRKGRGRRR